MSVETKALLKGNIPVVDIAKDLVELYGTDRHSVAVRFTFDNDFFKIEFCHRNKPNFGIDFEEAKAWKNANSRTMNVFYGCNDDYADVTSEECTYLSIGCWGESVEIMESLIKKYGGWIMPNDATDSWKEFTS